MAENKLAAEKIEMENDGIRINYFYDTEFLATVTIRPDSYIAERWHYSFNMADRVIDKLDLPFGDRMEIKERVYRAAGVAIRSHEKHGYAVISGVEKIRKEKQPTEQEEKL